MESNLPVISKGVWSVIRAAFFMLRKKLSKAKVMTDLNMILKRRSKLAGKAVANLMFHLHHEGSTSSRHSHNSVSSSLGKLHRSHLQNNSFTSTQAPSTPIDEATNMSTMKTIMNILKNDQAIVEASPALSGFEHSPTGRQLRVTDSPFPLNDDDEEKNNQIDMPAEEFIKRFYSQLRKQYSVIN